MRTLRIVCLVAVIVVFAGIPGRTVAAESGSRDRGAFSIGTEEQTGIAVTIYNVNLGLVRDRRKVILPAGEHEVRFLGVASEIIPASVHVGSLTDPGSFRVIEQNYAYDLLNPQKLLDTYVGKEVTLYEKNPYTEREEFVRATLLSNNSGPIFRIGDSIVIGHTGRIIFTGLPDNLVGKPTLVWTVRNGREGEQEIEASYLTNGITWRADYTVTVGEGGDRADISGWVTIDNRSGATYRDARLALIAGDVHRAPGAPEYQQRLLRTADVAAKAEPQFREEELFEYHRYTLDRAATIEENEMKQIGFLSADGVPVHTEFVFAGAAHYYYNRVADAAGEQKVGVFVEMENRRESRLGIPLPKGTMRVYKRDGDGGVQFIGEDLVNHTPKDQKVRIRLGSAFDVTGKRTQTDWKKIASDTYEAGFEIVLSNHKREDVVVKVIEPIPGDWTMLSASHPHRKTEAYAAEFAVPVKRDGETVLAYRVRMRF